MTNKPRLNNKAQLKELATSVLERAARDAAKGDPVAGAWLLSEPAEMYANVAGLEEGCLGSIANTALERLSNGV